MAAVTTVTLAEQIADLVRAYADEPHPSFTVEAHGLLGDNLHARNEWERYVEAVDNLLDMRGAVDPRRFLPDEDADLPLSIAYERAEESWCRQRDAAGAELLKAVGG